MQVKLARNIANGTPKTVVGSLKKSANLRITLNGRKNWFSLENLPSFSNIFLCCTFLPIANLLR